MEQKDIKRLIKVLIVVGASLLLIVIVKPQNYIKISDSSPAEKKIFDTSQYEWQDKNDAEKYKNATWNTIKESRLSGLTSVGDIIVEKEIACYWSEEPCLSLILKEDEYLRVEGGLGSRYYFLEVTKNGETQTVKSLEELRKFFAPVDNEIKAMSFIGVTENDLRSRLNNGEYTLVGEITMIDDGFLVQVVKNNTFGCGRHDPQRVIFKITKAGTIAVIAVEMLPPEPENTPHACVD